jgi:hypothetical protein
MEGIRGKPLKNAGNFYTIKQSRGRDVADSRGRIVYMGGIEYFA